MVARDEWTAGWQASTFIGRLRKHSNQVYPRWDNICTLRVLRQGKRI